MSAPLRAVVAEWANSDTPYVVGEDTAVNRTANHVYARAREHVRAILARHPEPGEQPPPTCGNCRFWCKPFSTESHGLCANASFPHRALDNQGIVDLPVTHPAFACSLHAPPITRAVRKPNERRDATFPERRSTVQAGRSGGDEVRRRADGDDGIVVGA